MPEQPSAATPEGSDGNALSLQLPAQLVVQSDGVVTITGGIGMAGFGSELSFETTLGGPHIADQAILFSYDGMGATWSIAGNRSGLATFVGESVVPQAVWMLPRTQTPPEEAFEAAHGGSLLIVPGRGTHRQPERSGRKLYRGDTGLLANALGLHLRSQNVEATARLPLSLWGPAKSDFEFGADIQAFNS